MYSTYMFYTFMVLLNQVFMINIHLNNNFSLIYNLPWFEKSSGKFISTTTILSHKVFHNLIKYISYAKYSTYVDRNLHNKFYLVHTQWSFTFVAMPAKKGMWACKIWLIFQSFFSHNLLYSIILWLWNFYSKFKIYLALTSYRMIKRYDSLSNKVAILCTLFPGFCRPGHIYDQHVCEFKNLNDA